MNRAYSLLEIKALDDDERVITGWASTPSPDRVGDIIDPMGAKFAAEIPLLWQHKHDQPVGTTMLGKPTRKGIPFTARIAKIAEDGPLKNLVDMAWQSVKARLVRGTSIGFRPLDYEVMKGGGIHFKSTEVYELSLATIPMNAEATIQTIKAMDMALRSGGPVRLVQAARPEDSGLPAGSVRLIR